MFTNDILRYTDNFAKQYLHQQFAMEAQYQNVGHVLNAFHVFVNLIPMRTNHHHHDEPKCFLNFHHFLKWVVSGTEREYVYDFSEFVPSVALLHESVYWAIILSFLRIMLGTSFHLTITGYIIWPSLLSSNILTNTSNILFHKRHHHQQKIIQWLNLNK